MTAPKYDVIPQFYHMGSAARRNGKIKSAPGHLDMRNRSWWLAGWNDMDMTIRGNGKK